MKFINEIFHIKLMTEIYNSVYNSIGLATKWLRILSLADNDKSRNARCEYNS